MRKPLLRVMACLMALSMALLMLLLMAPSTALASTGTGVSPGLIELEVEPGESVEDVVTVSNEGDKSATLQAYPMDRRVRSDGTIEFLPPGNPMDSPASWITAEVQEITLKPGQEQGVKFRLTVPPEAMPGDYVGVLFFEAKPEGGQQTVTITSRVGAVITVRVAGQAVMSGRLIGFEPPRPPLRLDLALFGRRLIAIAWKPFLPMVQRGPVNFSATFENTGNVRLPIDAEIAIKGLTGKPVATIRREEPLNVYPHDTGLLTLTWEDPPLIGRFVATGSFTIGNDRATAETVVYVVPLPQIAGVILIVLGAWLFVWLRRRSARRGRPEEWPTIPGPGPGLDMPPGPSAGPVAAPPPEPAKEPPAGIQPPPAQPPAPEPPGGLPSRKERKGRR